MKKSILILALLLVACEQTETKVREVIAQDGVTSPIFKPGERVRYKIQSATDGAMMVLEVKDGCTFKTCKYVVQEVWDVLGDDDKPYTSRRESKTVYEVELEKEAVK